MKFEINLRMCRRNYETFIGNSLCIYDACRVRHFEILLTVYRDRICHDYYIGKIAK